MMANSEERSRKKARLINVTSCVSTLNADGPIEEEETAQEKLKEVGFKPNNYTRLLTRVAFYSFTPMVHFAKVGDLKMCRFLLSKGASTTSGTGDASFPMYQAALYGHLDVCKWLHRNGASADIRRTNSKGFTPLGAAIAGECKDSRNITRWFILNGALSRDSDWKIDKACLRKNLFRFSFYQSEERPQLLSWALEILQTHHCFQVFLSGTLTCPEFSNELFCQLLISPRHRSCSSLQKWIQNTIQNTPAILLEEIWKDMYAPLQGFSGMPGLLEIIADYVGVMRSKRQLSLLQQLVPALRESLQKGCSSSSSSSLSSLSSYL